MKLKEVEIYTDGACSGNPGDGGWAAILFYKGAQKTVAGGERGTTNNRMELTAIIQGLSALKEKCLVKVFSDSAYAVDAFLKGWIFKWKQNGWKGDGGEIKNIDLWEKLLELTQKHKVAFIKVKGHSDNENNNMCDKLARAEISKLRK